jgi:hypothetical protein
VFLVPGALEHITATKWCLHGFLETEEVLANAPQEHQSTLKTPSRNVSVLASEPVVAVHWLREEHTSWWPKILP